MRALLTGSVRRVSHTTRFSGTPTLRPESVAEHHYITAQYALFMGRELNLRGQPVDMGVLLERALVHDLDEALMPDLPRPVKYSDPQLAEVWHRLAAQAVHRLGEELHDCFTHSWVHAKDRTLEGDILAAADMLAVVGYVIEEIRLGNSYMKEVLESSTGYIREFMQLRPDMNPELMTLVQAAYHVARIEWRNLT